MPLVDRAVDEAIRRIEATVADGGSYSELMAAIDACAALPDAQTVEAALLSWRITAALLHDRSAQECEAALIPYLALDLALVAHGSALLAVCATWPELARKYVPGLICALEAAPDSDGHRAMLESARKLRDE